MTKKELTSRKFLTSMLLFVSSTTALFTGFMSAPIWCGFMTTVFGVYTYSNIKEKLNLDK